MGDLDWCAWGFGVCQFLCGHQISLNNWLTEIVTCFHHSYRNLSLSFFGSLGMQGDSQPMRNGEIHNIHSFNNSFRALNNKTVSSSPVKQWRGEQKRKMGESTININLNRKNIEPRSAALSVNESQFRDHTDEKQWEKEMEYGGESKNHHSEGMCWDRQIWQIGGESP